MHDLLINGNIFQEQRHVSFVPRSISQHSYIYTNSKSDICLSIPPFPPFFMSFVCAQLQEVVRRKSPLGKKSVFLSNSFFRGTPEGKETKIQFVSRGKGNSSISSIIYF